MAVLHSSVEPFLLSVQVVSLLDGDLNIGSQHTGTFSPVEVSGAWVSSYD